MNTRLGDALLSLADAIGAASTIDDIFDAALASLRDVTGIARASILLFDHDGVMRFKKWSGISDRYRAAVEGHTPWTPGQEAPDPILVEDVAADPDLARYGRTFADEAIASLAFIPIVSRRKVIGKFMLYRGETGSFDPAAVTAALTIGHHIGFAVERARGEFEAEQAHARLMFALNAARTGTWDYDLVARRVSWSENLERIHGLPPGTFDGDFSSYEREIHSDDRARVLGSIQRALAEDVDHDVEYRIVGPDGTVRWVHGKGRIERDADGKPMRMSGVCMDISQRKHAEIEIADALRQEADIRERLSTLTQGSQRLLTTLDAQTVVEQVLALAEQVVSADAYGVWRRHDDTWRIHASRNLSAEFTAMQLPNDSSFAFDAPVIAADVQAPPMLEMRRAAYTREGIRSLMSIPLRVRDEPAGSIVFYYRTPHVPTEVEVRVASALGQLSAAAISNAELYAQQQALRREAQLAETRATFLAEASVLLSSLNYEDNLRRLAELAVPSLGDWCAVDLFKDGEIARLAVAHTDPAKVAFAHQVQQRYPTRLDEPGGMGDLFRTGEPQLYSTITDDMLVATARDAEHLQMLRALGIQSAMLAPLAASGRVFGAITFVSSTSDRRYTRADLAFAAELARRAALAIENARLYREVNEANRIKDEFLATLSHELRTPLNVIAGRARMLVEAAAVSDGVRQSADTIARNAETLARLVDDLLDVSRFSAGQVTLDMQRVQMPAVVGAVAASLEPGARAKGVALSVAPAAELPELLGDSTRLQQVVWNLLSNAIKFTPAGGSVSVVLSQTPTHVVLTVADTGEGIEPDFLPHVFETFRQAESARNRRHGGLGLGLSIVRRLVELHGGHVTAFSPGRGRGATFEVALPAAAVLSGT